MVDENLLSVDIESTYRKDAIALKGLKNNYYTRTINGKVQFLPSSKEILINQATAQIVLFLSYDSYGNPLEVKQQEGSSTVYIWGYGGQYPVAKIENASYDEIKAALSDASGTFLNQLTDKAVPTAADLTRLNGLRNHPTMRKAMVSTYTYQPLVGMTSMTDPRGIIEHYQYDGFQRLKHVLDFDNNILQDYRYHYRP